MRQFISECELDRDGCIRTESGKFHYLTAVLRLVPGDMLSVRLPSGALQQMTVAKVDAASRQLILSLAGRAADGKDGGAAQVPARAGGPRFQLFQLVPKPPRLDLIIRQAAECGVCRIIPVAGEFCQKGNVESAVKKSSPSDSRWKKIITEAREQSGSPVQTELLPCMDFGAACEFWKAGGSPDAPRMAFVLYERSAGTLPVHRALASASSLENSFENADIAVMVGAEGGISPSELETAKESGFIPIHLETNILRCETAALYGLAALQNALAESDIWKLKE